MDNSITYISYEYYYILLSREVYEILTVQCKKIEYADMLSINVHDS